MLLWDDHGTTYAGYRDPQALSDLFDLADHRDVPAKLSEFMTQLAFDLSVEH